MRTWTRLGAAVAVAATVATGAWAGGSSVATAGSAATVQGPAWASAAKATIHPGVRIEMGGVTCLAGYILTDGKHAFIAVPASCSGGTTGETTDGCSAANDPLGLPVTIQGAKHKGTFVYSSFVAMQLRSETRPNYCGYNSLTLVRIDRRDIKRTNPSVPAVGGPTGLAKDQPALPDQLTAYLSAPTPAQAISSDANGWSHAIMVDGAVSGADVGAPVITDSGRALGMVTLIPQSTGETFASNLRRELQYLHRTDRFADVHLAKGTQPYTSPGFAAPLG